MSQLRYGIAAALLLCVGCGGGVVKASYKPVAIKGQLPAVEEPAPKPEPKPVAAKIVDNKIEISDKIHFKTKSARIRRKSLRVLDEVVQVMNENPEIVVEIQGHTDARGSDRRNRRLSSRRAQRVQEYLIKRGIDPRRVEAVGHGEERPVASNGSRNGRYKNRRVDFVVVGELDESQRSAARRSFDNDDDDDDDDDFEGEGEDEDEDEGEEDEDEE